MVGLTEPVSCRGERCLLCSGAEREDLANDDPGERTPGHGEGSNEHASSDDHHDARALVLCWRACNGNRGEDQQPRRLPESAVDQWDTATESFDQVQTGESGCNVDGSEDQLDEKWVVDTG